MIGNESPPQAPKFLGYKVSHLAKLEGQGKIVHNMNSAAEGGRKSPATPPLLFKKSTSKGGG